MTKDIEMGTVLRPAIAMRLIVCAAAFSFSNSVYAQPVERHPARILSGNQITSLPGSTVDAGALDSTPFGANLSGVVIVSDKSAVRGAAKASGIVVRSDNQHLSNPEFAKLLSPYLGQPLSRRLIGEIRDTITQYMRKRKRPLVAVIVPPQEVTGGVVQLLVVPFVVGEKHVSRIETGYDNTPESRVLDTVRIGPGDEVEADTLLEDLNWLNLNPFRQVGVVFQPGKDVGTTDLTFSLSDQKPWQVYGGYANSGTAFTGLDRVFAGFVIANAALGDQQLSYQFTSLPEAIGSDGFSRDSAYLAHSLGYFVPLAWSNSMRHKLTLRGDYTRSRSDLTDPFVSEDETWQASFDYAGNLPGVFGFSNPSIEWFVGGDFKRQESDIFFDGISIFPNVVEVVQFNLGLRGRHSGTWMGHAHQTEYAIKGVFSPGEITTYNTDAAFIAASNNTAGGANYNYLTANFTHHVSLPLKFSFDLAFAGQTTSGSLPSTEKFGIGGVGSVRGYETNERSGDTGVSVQAELHLPVFPLLKGGKISANADVFAFADYGSIHEIATNIDHELSSAGVGVNIHINNNVRASMVWGHAFDAGITSATGNNRVHVTFTTSF
ncbi:MAG: ShlB/FhaC/HecB family hemolysin secretion/activation protein [Rhizobiaceae bacterium]|nr:ShlB/FhaC/HecB family hemolysin secretion/activation protein [Rhizobiaceae bacterium]